MTAEWLPVTGYEGLYEVSNQGEVRSLARSVKGRECSDRQITGKVIVPRIRPDGTVAVNLWKSNTYKQVPVRRIVLLAFDGPRPKGYDATNVNGDPGDNRLHNLQWQPDRRSRAALRRGAVVAVLTVCCWGLTPPPHAQAGCSYANRTVTCEGRYQDNGSYQRCQAHAKLVGGLEFDCTRVCPPLPGSSQPRPYIAPGNCD